MNHKSVLFVKVLMVKFFWQPPIWAKFISSCRAFAQKDIIPQKPLIATLFPNGEQSTGSMKRLKIVKLKCLPAPGILKNRTVPGVIGRLPIPKVMEKIYPIQTPDIFNGSSTYLQTEIRQLQK